MQSLVNSKKSFLPSPTKLAIVLPGYDCMPGANTGATWNLFDVIKFLEPAETAEPQDLNTLMNSE